MTKTAFLIAGLFLNLAASGQLAKSKVVNITVPEGALSLTKDQATKVVKAKFKRSGTPLDANNYYQLDGLIISLWDAEGNRCLGEALRRYSLVCWVYLRITMIWSTLVR